MIDRFLRWHEVIPIQDIRFDTVANAFVMHWEARNGTPETMITDRGAQFEKWYVPEINAMSRV